MWKVPPASQLLQQTRSDTAHGWQARGGSCHCAELQALQLHPAQPPCAPATTVATETEGSGQCHLLSVMSKGSLSREGQGPWGCLPSLGGQVGLLDGEESWLPKPWMAIRVKACSPTAFSSHRVKTEMQQMQQEEKKKGLEGEAVSPCIDCSNFQGQVRATLS